MKRGLIVFAIIALILGAVAITMICLKEKPIEENKKESIQPDEEEMKVVKLNEEIELRKNETVKLEGKEVYLTIKGFTNSPAPEGTQAIWSGLGVTYELKIDDVEYVSSIQGFFNEYEDIKYKVITIDSDYKTYAKVKIEEKYDEIEEVDEYINKILNDEEFKELSKEERIEYMKNELEKLATEGTEKIKKPLIKKSSIQVDDKHSPYTTSISFEYSSGILGGVLIPNEMKLTYKINNEMNIYSSKYTKRGIYYDTLNTPNAPSYYIIAMGEQSSGGYKISVEKVTIDDEGNAEIIVKEEGPNEGESATTVMTYPVCGVEFNGNPKKVIVKNTKGERFKSINY